jgi:hypothetical protein
MGEKVFQKEFKTINFKLQTTLDVSFLAKGLYFLKAVNEVRKFVKE